MPDLERPEWLHDGAEVYALRARNGSCELRTVTRATSKQVIVNTGRGGEERFWLADLKRLGNGDVQLVRSDHPEVMAYLAAERASASMQELRAVIDQLSYGAQLYKNEPSVALKNAILIRNAAQAAIDGMTGAGQA